VPKVHLDKEGFAIPTWLNWPTR